MAIIDVADLPTSLQSADMVGLMVDGANAHAARVAPCLVATDTPPTADQLAEARLILVGAVKRWVETGSGSFQSQTAGPFGVQVDTRQRGGYYFQPSEVTGLARLCADSSSSDKAFEIDTAPADSGTGYWSAPDVWTPVAP